MVTLAENAVYVAFICVGAISGALLRYAVDILAEIYKLAPYHLTAVNVFGSFIIGITYRKYISDYINYYIYLLLSVGFCSSFTTFSSYALNLILLLEKGHYWQSVIFFLLNNFLCMLAVWIGLSYI